MSMNEHFHSKLLSDCDKFLKISHYGPCKMYTKQESLVYSFQMIFAVIRLFFCISFFKLNLKKSYHSYWIHMHLAN